MPKSENSMSNPIKFVAMSQRLVRQTRSQFVSEKVQKKKE